MTMRLVIELPQPLNQERKTSLLLALAALPKTGRVKVRQGGFAVEVMGEALGVDRVRAALEAEGVAVQAIHSSLRHEDDLVADEVSPDRPEGRERFRPIGR